MYDIHPRERLCMRERLGNEFPFPWVLFLSKSLFASFFIHLTFFGFLFSFAKSFLDMNLLHKTWGDDLLANDITHVVYEYFLVLDFVFLFSLFSFHFECGT
jgi:hypothetical protein